MNLSESDWFDLATVRQALRQDAIKRWFVFDQVESTNDLAKAESLDASDLPALFIARRQTAGRGRGGNRWISPDGGVYCSLVVQESWSPHLSANLLPIVVGIAVCRAIESLQGDLPAAEPRLKWPNDVLLRTADKEQNRPLLSKVAGLLIESQLDSKGERRLVIGCGINVDQSGSSGNDPIPLSAICIRDAASINVTRESVLVGYLNALEELRHQAKDNDFIQHEWCRLSAHHDRSVVLTNKAGRTHGICRGVDSEGAILLEVGDCLRRFSSGSLLLDG